MVSRVHRAQPWRWTAREPCASEAGEMKGQRRRREAELISNLPRRQAGRPRLHEQPEDGKPRTLRKRSQRLDCLLRFHISRIIEI